jgi:Flp pilus assembly protein TadD
LNTIVGRNAARRYRGRDAVEERTVERELGVRFLLTGSLRRNGSRLTIGAQLNDSVARAEIWSDAFVLDTNDFRAVLAKIVEAGAEALRARDPSRFARPTRAMLGAGTTNDAALQEYLRGQAALKRRGLEIRQSAAHFENAIMLDPGFPRPRAALATALTFFPVSYGVALDEVSIRVQNEARDALSLDSTLADAHTALAILYGHRGEWSRSVEESRRAIALEPYNFEAHFNYGRISVNRGDLGEALTQLHEARRLEPASPVVSAWTAYALFLSGRVDSARQEGAKAIRLDSALGATKNLMSLMSIGTGQPEIAQQLMAADPPVSVMSNAPYVYAKLGDSARAMRVVTAMESNTSPPWYADMERASVMLALGDTAAALSAMERSARSPGALTAPRRFSWRVPRRFCRAARGGSPAGITSRAP